MRPEETLKYFGFFLKIKPNFKTNGGFREENIEALKLIF